MEGIRAWDYENKEFYIEDNFNYILEIIRTIGEITVSNNDVYSAENNNRELSEMLAVKSVQGTPKEEDTYEILFRERVINRFYDLENPKEIDDVRIYSVDDEKLEELIIAAKNQSAEIFLENEE